MVRWDGLVEGAAEVASERLAELAVSGVCTFILLLHLQLIRGSRRGGRSVGI